MDFIIHQSSIVWKSWIYFTLTNDYDKYDFDISELGGVPHASHEYFDQHPSEGNYFTFHIEPGEKKEIVIGYLYDAREVPLSEAVFSNGELLTTSDPFTTVHLKLEG